LRELDALAKLAALVGDDREVSETEGNRDRVSAALAEADGLAGVRIGTIEVARPDPRQGAFRKQPGPDVIGEGQQRSRPVHLGDHVTPAPLREQAVDERGPNGALDRRI
jgi:hypothetical protein